nr:hypothetical protein [FCB group bacterium]
SPTVDVHGSLLNEGIIQNNPEANRLIVRVRGDFEQSGSCTNYAVNLDGSEEQNISLTGNSKFECLHFRVFGENRFIYAMTDLIFEWVDIDLQFKTLILEGESGITVTGGRFENGFVEAGGNTLTMNSTAWIEEMTFLDVVLEDVIAVGVGVVFNGETVNNALIQNQSEIGVFLEINDYFTNNQTLSSNPEGGALVVHIAGDLENNGAFEGVDTHLMADHQQQFTGADWAEFYESYLYLNPDGGSLNVTGDFHFRDSDINLWENSILMNGTLYLDGGRVFNGDILGNGHILSMSNEAWMEFVEVSDIILSGIVEVETDVIFSGSLTVAANGILQHKEGGHRSILINGNLINQGEIRDSQYLYNLNMTIDGNITNNGIWTSGIVTAVADSDCYIQLNTPLAVREFIAQAGTTGQLIFTHGLKGNGTDFDFNQHTVRLGSDTYSTVSDGITENAIIQGAGNGLTLTDGSYVRDCHIYELDLQGIFQVGENVEFHSPTEVTGVLQNRWPDDSSVIFHVDLINNSTIRDDPEGYNLELLLYGDFIQNGFLTNDKIRFSANEPQTISMGSGAPIESAYFYGNGLENGLISSSDLAFYNCRVSLETGSLSMPENASLLVSNRYFRNGTVYNNGGTLTLQDGAYLENIHLDDVIFDGEVTVAQNCVVSTHLENLGILQGSSAGETTLHVDGDLYNSGTIQNSVDWAHFKLEVTGDVANTGTMDNFQTDLLGLGLQSLYLLDGIPITTQVRLFANVGTDDHQWYRNDFPLEFSYDYYGFTTGVLAFLVDMDDTWTGIYNCNSNLGWSRNIMITAGAVGCTDPLAYNYDPGAVYDNGECYGYSDDLNEDTELDVLDIVIIVDLILNTEPDAYQLWAGDINGDGNLDVLDIVALVAIILAD